MKYMGSKRAMLQNGLGELLGRELAGTRRFVDLFAGSGAVATYVAMRFPIPVLAFDLQRYSVILTDAIINRQTNLDWQSDWRNWHRRAKSLFNTCKIPVADNLTKAIVVNFREWCDQQTKFPITHAYGGHYFSPKQAVWIDSLRVSVPKHEPTKTVALAALIQAASQCAAAPGHTAQPFQPTRTAKRFLKEAWSKDIVSKTRTTFESLSGLFAKRRGQAKVDDANLAASRLRENDLAFIDPPYSGVHYSRFYHVLETIADGDCGEVSGIGRYPAREKRPRSKYSVSSESAEAIRDLLEKVSTRGARAILTFPDHDCSNGLSGDLVREAAMQFFYVQEEQVESAFSTLGGTGDERDNETGRAARRHTRELMLILEPK